MIKRVRLACGDHWFDSWTGQTKDLKMVMCCLSAKHEALNNKSKDWSVRSQNNVSG